MQRDVRVGKVAHAKPVNDCIEGVGIEGKRFRISLVEADAGIALVRRSDLGRRKIDPNGISPAQCGGRSNVTRPRCDIQNARSVADARGVEQRVDRLGCYAG